MEDVAPIQSSSSINEQVVSSSSPNTNLSKTSSGNKQKDDGGLLPPKTNPVVMDYSGKFLRGRNGAEQFANLIANNEYSSNTKVRHLKYSNNKSGPDGIYPLKQGMNQLQNLEIVELENNFFGGGFVGEEEEEETNNDDDNQLVEQFTDIFNETSNITTLRLDGNNFGRTTIGAKSLGKALTFDNDEAKQSHDEGQRHEASSSRLQFLYLSSNLLGRNDRIQYLAKPIIQNHRNLLVLDLSNNGIGSKGAEYLAQIISNNVNLMELRLSNNCLGGDGARHLVEPIKSLTRLRKLDISRNDLGADGANYIAQALSSATTETTKLYSLDISNNNLGSEGAAYISRTIEKLVKLMQLDISSNNLGYSGAEHLATGLQNHAKLADLNLSSSAFGTRGIHLIAPSLETLPKLMNLDLSNNFMGSGGVKHLVKIMKRLGKQLQLLDLAGNALFGNGELLDYEIIERRSQFAEALTTNINLMHLNVSLNDLGSEGGSLLLGAMEQWGKNSRLKTLDMSCNSLGPDVICKLDGVLGNAGSLQKLNLSRNQLGVEGAKQLSQILAYVEDLDLSSNSLGTNEEAVKFLKDSLIATPSGNAMLTKLDLSCNYIGVNGGMQHLEQLLQNQNTIASLRELNLASNNIGQNVGIYNAVSGIEHLTFLDLSANALGVQLHRGVSKSNAPEQQFAIALGTLKELKYLNLSSNQFGEIAFQHIVHHAFEQKASLSHLNLSYNRLGACSDDNTRKFIDIVHNSLPGLDHLNITYNGMSDEKLNLFKQEFKTLKNKLGIRIHIDSSDNSYYNNNNKNRQLKEQQETKKKQRIILREMVMNDSSSLPLSARIYSSNHHPVSQPILRRCDQANDESSSTG